MLIAHVDRWHEAQRPDAYLDAMGERVAGLSSEEQRAAEEWLAWARERRRRGDPLGQSLHLPPDPEFKPDVIAPFMRELSPYGPSGF